jgi:hypothetical protein
MSGGDAIAALGEAQSRASDALRPVLPRDVMALVVVGNRLWMRQDLLQPQPLALLHLAQSLIEQAAEMLPEGDPLREQAEYAASQLPDRFEEEEAAA